MTRYPKSGRGRKWTVAELKAIRPDWKGDTLADGEGLSGTVRNSDGDTVTIHWRYAFKRDGRVAWHYCGTWPIVSLEAVRLARDAARDALRRGADPNEKRQADRIEERERVGGWHTFAIAVATAIEIAAPHGINGSPTLWAYRASGASIGAVLAYRRASFAWAGKGRQKCLAAATPRIAFAVLAYGLLVLASLWIISPYNAGRYAFVRVLRELLLSDMLVLNFIQFLGSGAAAYFLAYALVVLSPSVANPRKPLYGDHQ